MCLKMHADVCSFVAILISKLIKLKGKLLIIFRSDHVVSRFTRFKITVVSTVM